MVIPEKCHSLPSLTFHTWHSAARMSIPNGVNFVFGSETIKRRRLCDIRVKLAKKIDTEEVQ